MTIESNNKLFFYFPFISCFFQKSILHLFVKLWTTFGFNFCQKTIDYFYSFFFYFSVHIVTLFYLLFLFSLITNPPIVNKLNSNNTTQNTLSSTFCFINSSFC